MQGPAIQSLAGLAIQGTTIIHDPSPHPSPPFSSQDELAAFAEQGEIGHAEERLLVVQDLQTRLGQLAERAQLYAAREDVFAVKTRTEHPLLEQLQKRLEPYVTLWLAAAELGRSLPNWMDGPLAELDATAVAADCDRWAPGCGSLLSTPDSCCALVPGIAARCCLQHSSGQAHSRPGTQHTRTTRSAP